MATRRKKGAVTRAARGRGGRRRRRNPIDSKEEFIKKERLRQAILSLRILRGAAPGRTVTPWASFTAATAQRIMRAPGNKYRHFVDALRRHLAPTTNRKNPRRPRIRHADARWLSAYRDYIMQTRPKGWSFDRWYRVFRSLENLSDKGRIGRDFKIHRYPEGEADRLARAVRHARKRRRNPRRPTRRRNPLWKYNKAIGVWDYARGVSPETAPEWLRIYQRDEPDEHFVVSDRKPTRKPSARRRNPWPAFLNGIAGGAGFFAANKVLGAVGRVNGRRRKRRRR